MNRKFAYITHTHTLLRSSKYICFSWSVLLPSGKLLLPIPKFSKMAKDLMFFTPLLPFSRGFRNYKINYCPTESSKGVCFCGKALTVVGVWFAVIFFIHIQYELHPTFDIFVAFLLIHWYFSQNHVNCNAVFFLCFQASLQAELETSWTYNMTLQIHQRR